MRHLLFSATFLVLFACSDRNESTKETEYEQLNLMLVNLQTNSSDISCTNPAEWKFVAIGSRACGGPSGFIGYHVSEEAFILSLVEAYTNAEENFNEKWGIISPCDIITAPKGIACVDGKAVLTYE